ncbi:hypothetical protein K1719_002777 [Acacia pycnantha]|nr:hypothetical protein K1719_002777 [Acacia pycnantha]
MHLSCSTEILQNNELQLEYLDLYLILLPVRMKNFVSNPDLKSINITPRPISPTPPPSSPSGQECNWSYFCSCWKRRLSGYAFDVSGL